MQILPNTYGYIVTDQETTVRTFNESDYPSRQQCLADAVTFAEKLKNINKDFSNIILAEI
jgi:hypothetical protein